MELIGKLANETTYNYWTFNGKVPGPFLRVRLGDTVKLTFKNRETSRMIHSVDLHAVTGPGGGAVMTQTPPGEKKNETKAFSFKALNPGLYVYHCATPMVANHITSGMYGLILVEPVGGLPKVDREFYVMQGELYTDRAFGQRGHDEFSVEKLLAERAEYFVFNGAVGALTAEHPMKAKVGETVRIYFGVGGPNATSSFHVIGEIFDRVYDQAAIGSPGATNVQTTTVPAGGATIVEFKLEVPGRYILVDHALSRLERGLAASWSRARTSGGRSTQGRADYQEASSGRQQASVEGVSSHGGLCGAWRCADGRIRTPSGGAARRADRGRRTSDVQGCSARSFVAESSA